MVGLETPIEDNVLGIKKEFITCRVCGQPGTMFRLLATEVADPIQEGVEPKVIGVVVGFLCQACTDEGRTTVQLQ